MDGEKVNVLVLLSHAIVGDLLLKLQKTNITLIRINGVATNLLPEDMEKDYQATKNSSGKTCYYLIKPLVSSFWLEKKRYK